MATAKAAAKKDTGTGTVVVKYDTPKTVNVDDFLRAALKEMLVADSDTLHVLAEVENPDKTLTKIKFDLIITELTNEKV